MTTPVDVSDTMYTLPEGTVFTWDQVHLLCRLFLYSYQGNSPLTLYGTDTKKYTEIASHTDLPDATLHMVLEHIDDDDRTLVTRTYTLQDLYTSQRDVFDNLIDRICCQSPELMAAVRANRSEADI